MAFLAGKKILIAGLLSNRSIAYGIAAAMKREGAELALTSILPWYCPVMSPKMPRSSSYL